MDLVGQNLSEIRGWLEEVGEPSYRAKQIFDWLYKKNVLSLDRMINLPNPLREKIALRFTFPCLLEKIENSCDSETVKYLWKLADGKLVESVLIISGQRRTICLSSQIGCPARCAFCASGREGFIRNLTSGEILEQVLQTQNRLLNEQGEQVTHVVFMGMGEPLEPEF